MQVLQRGPGRASVYGLSIDPVTVAVEGVDSTGKTVAYSVTADVRLPPSTTSAHPHTTKILSDTRRVAAVLFPRSSVTDGGVGGWLPRLTPAHNLAGPAGP